MTEEEVLLSKIDKKNLPKHIAIIMDGNGRWAQKRNLPRIAGHKEGIKSLKDVVEAALDLGIKTLTVFAFSTENWKRPKHEINTIFNILYNYIKKEKNKLVKEKIRLRVSGDITPLPSKLVEEINELIERTKYNDRFTLNIALNYGSRAEIIRAVNKIIKSGIKEIDEKGFEKFLYTNGLEPLDLLIRTSGEKRISNFLLWQIAYTELYFTETLWPDFRAPDLYKAIIDYQLRQRRFGGI